MGTASQYCLRWNNHQTNLLTSFDSLLRQEAFTDVTLACEDGVNLHAHRLVLAACSSYFASLFSTTSPLQHPIVVLKDVEAVEMRALLNYMYRGEVNVEQSHLKSLLKVAESLKVKGLVEDLASDTQTQPLSLITSHSRPLPPLITQDQNNELRESRVHSPSVDVKEPCDTTKPMTNENWDHNRKTFCSPPHSPSKKSRLHPPIKEEYPERRTLSPPPQHPYIHHLNQFNHQPRIPPLHLDHKEFRGIRDILEREKLDASPRNTIPPEDLREGRPSPLSLMPHLESIHNPDSPSSKRSRHLVGDPLISPTPILRTALAHTRSFPSDVSSFVSLANSMIPLPSLLSTRVPTSAVVSIDDCKREPIHQEQHFGITQSKNVDYISDEDSRHFSDIVEEEGQEKVNNGQLVGNDFPNYSMDRHNPVHFSNFVSYVPNPKPEWKRYKQYTKTDLMDAIAAVKKGMTALQASRKYKVPSRTLYDKIKKMGINTIPKRLPSKRLNNTDLESVQNETLKVVAEVSSSLKRRAPPSPVGDFYRHNLMHRDHQSLGEEMTNSNALQLSTLHVPTSDEDPPTRSHSREEDGNVSYGEESSPIETTRGSFSLVGRKVFPDEDSATPLDLTDSEVVCTRTTTHHIEERA